MKVLVNGVERGLAGFVERKITARLAMVMLPRP
jgi:hypothetical protein